MRLTLFAIVLGMLVACQPAESELTLRGLALAGPVCPVVTDPPDPACEDRPVSGAEIVILNEAGKEVARVRTGDDGTFSTPVVAGRYELVPQPVEGLMGTAAPIEVVVADGQDPDVALIGYDTGIR
jgi:hypothetical protein